MRGEYLFSQSTPVSIWLGYDYTSFHVTGFSENSNAVSVGLSYYIGGPSGSLMARQRSGVDTFGPSTIDVRF